MSSMLFDIVVHDLAAGDKHLLQKSRNEAGLQAGSVAHLDCRLRLKSGEKHLLLGKNGCGKTTLLRAIAKGIFEDIPKDLSIFLVEQDGGMDRSQTPLEAVLAADITIAALEKEAASLEEACAEAVDDAEATEALVERLNGVCEKLYEEDESQRRRRADDVLRGLGFDTAMLEKPLSELSGGWQMRASLAAGLFMKPDLLLLDEPTNQLDLFAIGWLQDHLSKCYRGTVLCVSHDREFINEVATEIISFGDDHLDYFSGNLDDLDEEAAKSSINLERQSAALEKKRAHIEKSIAHMKEAEAKRNENRSSNKDKDNYAPMQDGFKRSNNQVAQRLKKLDRMGLEKNAHGKRYKAQVEEGPRIGSNNNNDGGWVNGKMTAAPLLHREDPAFKFYFDADDPLELGEDDYLIELHDVEYNAPGSDQTVLSKVDLRIPEGCRAGCIGKNGAGKSTLLKLLTGRFAPSQGEVVPQCGLRVAYMGQHDAEQLQIPATALEHLQETFPQIKEVELLAKLEEFGLRKTTDNVKDAHPALRPLESLSGGQRVRVAFAKMSLERPHLLVLDEPTNHLDIYAIESLIDALKRFEGGVIFVTHNQSLLKDVAQQVISVKDSGVSIEYLSNQVLDVKNGVVRADNMVLLD